MGQYYTPIIIRGNSIQTFYSHDYDNGLKLMEHSYIGNKFVETVLRQLLDKKAHLAWVGDYAEAEDVKSELAQKFIDIESSEREKKYRRNPAVIGDFENSFYLVFVNHTKKEYIDMTQYITCNKILDKWGMTAHPIPILTAIGNGKGGGDYHGTCEDKVGYWACDVIEATFDDEKFKGYKNITPEIRFVEGEE